VTLWDWLFVVPGVALTWSPQASYSMVWVSRLVVTPAMVVVAVLIGRQLRYRRRPSPAEWLSLLIVARFATSSVPNLDNTIDWLASWFGGSSDPPNWSPWRWALSGLAGVVAAAVIAVAWRAGQRRPAWWQSLVIVAGVTLVFWGPMRLVFELLWWAFDVVQVLSWPEWHQECCFGLLFAVRQLPWALLFSIAAVAVLQDWRRRGQWRWTDWVSVVAAAVILLATAVLSVLFGMHWPTMVGRLVSLAAALWCARWIVKRWSRYDRCGGSGGAASTSISGGSWPAAQ
jgi:hypothetical protein